MIKKNNIKGKKLQSIINDINFIPNSNFMIVTINQYESKNDLELVSDKELTLDEWQYVVAAGPGSRYKAGDKVYLHLKRLVKKVVDPTDRMKYVEQIDIIPFSFKNNLFAVMDDNCILGKENNEYIDIKV